MSVDVRDFLDQWREFYRDSLYLDLTERLINTLGSLSLAGVDKPSDPHARLTDIDAWIRAHPQPMPGEMTLRAIIRRYRVIQSGVHTNQGPLQG